MITFLCVVLSSLVWVPIVWDWYISPDELVHTEAP